MNVKIDGVMKLPDENSRRCHLNPILKCQSITECQDGHVVKREQKVPNSCKIHHFNENIVFYFFFHFLLLYWNFA